MKKYGINISFDGEHRLTKELEKIAEQHRPQGGVMDSREQLNDCSKTVDSIGSSFKKMKLNTDRLIAAVTQLRATVDSQQAKIDALKAMLKKHEWSGMPQVFNSYALVCLECGHIQEEGHAADCELDKQIKE